MFRPTPQNCHAIFRLSQTSYLTSKNFSPQNQIRNTHYDASLATFERFGSPERVLKIEKEKFTPNLTGSQVLLKVLAAPIHPGDLTYVKGAVNFSSSGSKTPGIGCVAQVIELSPNASGKVKRNDRVIALSSNGTWKTHLVCDEKELSKIEGNVDNVQSSLCAVDYITANSLINQFAKLKTGDVIIQSAGDSYVGQLVSVLASNLGVKVISVASSGSKESIERATKAGSTLVVTPEELRSSKYSQLSSKLPKPKLALNPSCGPVATDLVRQLDQGGVLVTYGNDSLKPLQVPASYLIFKDVSLRGFSLSNWLESNSVEKRGQILDLAKNDILNKSGKLPNVSTKVFPFTSTGLSSALSELDIHQTTKFVFSME